VWSCTPDSSALCVSYIRPILMVSVNMNIECSMFMFVHNFLPYGLIFQHDIENSMQALVMSHFFNMN
jgi:hypothetical protein